MDRFLHARLTATAGPDLGPFKSTPLDELVPLLRWLGLAASLPWSGRWPRTRDGDARDPVEIGARIAADWPYAFLRVLDEGSGRIRCSARAAGMIGRYGWVYEQFASGLGEGKAQTAVRSVLRDHAVAAQVVAPGEAVLGFAARDGSMGIVAAGRMMGVSFDRARRLLRSDGRVPEGSRRGVRQDISRRDVLLLAGRRRGVGVRDLGRRLGIGRKAMQGLVGTRLFEAARISSDGGADTFDEARAAAIVADMGRAFEAPTRRSAHPLVDPVAATRISGLTMSQLLERVGAGTLRSVFWPGDRALADARFRYEDVIALRSTKATSTLSAVARRLGLHPEAAQALAMEGLLVGERNGSVWRVTEEDVAAFGRDYVTGVELAALTGSSPRAIVSRLSTHGVHPVAGPPRCRQVVYRREVIARASALNFHDERGSCQTGEGIEVLPAMAPESAPARVA